MLIKKRGTITRNCYVLLYVSNRFDNLKKNPSYRISIIKRYNFKTKNVLINFVKFIYNK